MSAANFPDCPLHTLYQPIVELKPGKVMGYEALTRGTGKWRLPEDLFRSAYQKGTTVALDFRCLRTALQILPKLGRTHLLFVNVEPMTLSHLVRKKRQAAFLGRKMPVNRRQIVFELTEGMKGRDFGFIKQGVAFLRGLGYRFAIDDVSGIGSKLFKLLSLNPDFVKIDISFVKGVAQSRFQQAFIRRLVRLGKEKGTLLIAEGVERKEDLNFVKRAGIPYAQGYYFARPGRTLWDAL